MIRPVVERRGPGTGVTAALVQADDPIVQLVRGRRIGELAQPVGRRWDGAEAALGVADDQHGFEVGLVYDGGDLLGAIGPRQIERLRGRRGRLRVRQLMVPLRALEVLPPNAPAERMLPQLARHGFALTWLGGGISYVEEHELSRRLLVADIRRRVADEGPEVEDR